jgi:hypothetical protein
MNGPDTTDRKVGVSILERARGILPILLLLLTLAAIFYKLFLGEVLYWGLPALQFYPWRLFAMSEFAAGRLPLWNPYNGAGAPLLANYQSALLYPPHLLYFLFSGPQMMGWLGLLHLVWAGMGMYFLARRFGFSPLGQGIAVLSYPLCNTIVARFGTFPMVDVAAWLPWLLLVTDRLIAVPGALNISLLALVIGLLLLAGHAQWAFYSLLLVGGYTLWRFLFNPAADSWWGRFKPLAYFGLAGLFGAAIAAAQLLPTAELQRQSQRADSVNEDFAFNFSYPPPVLLTFLNPNFYGNPGDGSYAIPGLYYENAAYIGFFPLILALAGWVAGWHRRRRKTPLPHDTLIPFFTLVAVGGVILAFGKYTFIYPALYRHVPTFNLFQAPARWLILTIFALIMLAGFATIEWKADRRGRRRARLGVFAAVSVMLAGLAWGAMTPKAANSGNPNDLNVNLGQKVGAILPGSLATTGVLALLTAIAFTARPIRGSETRWTIGVLLFLAVDLGWTNMGLNPTTPPDFYKPLTPVSSDRGFWPDPKSEPLPGAVYDNYLTFSDYRVLGQKADAFRRAEYPDLNLIDRVPLFNNFDPLRPEGSDRFLKLLNTEVTPALRRIGAISSVGNQITEGSGQTMPRVWLASKALILNMDDAATKLSDLPADTVILTGDVALPDQLTGSDTPGNTVAIVNETPQALTLHTTTTGASLLVLADTYYPGWSAKIDGQASTIYRANLAFRAILVPAGDHRVEMTYDPPLLKIGAAISLFALLVAGGLLIGSRIRH